MKNIEHWLRIMITGMSMCYRWGGMKASYKESVSEHTLKMVWITQIMLAVEDAHGNPMEIDFFRVLQCANNHDLAEGVVGDIPLPKKTRKDDEVEAEVYESLIKMLVPPDLRGFFPQPIDRDITQNPTHRMFWNALERVGYALFAIEELRMGNSGYWIVLDTNLEELELKYMMFPSVERFVDEIKRMREEELDGE